MNLEESRDIIKNALEQIKNLIADEKLAEAHKLCLDILRYDPENIKIIKLKNKIEKRVNKLNTRSINADLKKLQIYWKHRDFTVLMESLQALKPYASQNRKLAKFIQKVQAAYNEEIKKERHEAFQREFQKIQVFLQEHKYQEALRNAEKLRIARISEEKIKELISKVKGRWIEFEIEQNRALINSEKYEDTLIFLQSLYRIDKNSERVKSLMNKVKKIYSNYKIEQKREYIYKELEKYRTLFQLKKYDQALSTIMGLMEIDPNNKKIKRHYMKCFKKVTSMMNRELDRQMKVARKAMKESFKKSKKDFIKI